MRKRLEYFGAESLNDHELLEMLLYLSIPRADTNLIAHKLLDRFDNICGVLNADTDELEKIDGIGKSSACAIKTVAAVVGRYIKCENKPENAFFDFARLGNYLVGLFAGEARERLYLLVLDQKGRIIDETCIGDGVKNSVQISVRKIADTAIRHNATHVVLAHNHPGGCAAPSEEDIELTLRAREMLSLIGITLFEHFVVCDNRYRLILAGGIKF